MNKKELFQKLIEAGVSSELHNLDETGRKDERFCLENQNGQWEVYFTERGIKTTNEIFSTEEDACQYIFNQLVD